MSTRLVTSTTTTTVSTFPTGAFISMEYSKFHINYWWLRSPATGIPYDAWQVYLDGDVRYNGYVNGVNDSYGRKDRRKRVGTIVLVVSSRLVTSTTTTTVSRIPMGQSAKIVYVLQHTSFHVIEDGALSHM